MLIRCWIMFVLLLGALAQDAFSAMLPGGTPVENVFRPGFGPSIGSVQLVQGPVFIVHDQIPAAFQAKIGLPLYKGDIFYTEDNGRVRFALNDGSIMTLASHSQLALTQSVFDPGSKTRSSFLKLTLGKARFIVKKLFGFREASFKVKTSTFVAGVRGSDFIITTMPKHTEVVALEHTVLEVVSLAAPEAAPTILRDFQRTSVILGQLPKQPETLSREMIESIKEGFAVTGERPGSETDSGSNNTSSSSLKKGALSTPGRQEAPQAGPKPEIMINPTELTDLEVPDQITPMNEPSLDGWLERMTESEPIGETKDQIESIAAEQREDSIKILPGLPPAPSH